MKNKNLITLYEFEPPKEVPLRKNIAYRLSIINERLKKDQDILTVYPTGKNRYKLKAYNHVGVIQVGNTKIEILPKLYKNKKEAKLESLKNLHYMLWYTKKLPIRETSTSVFRRIHDEFLEIYISIFLKELEETLRTTIFRQYVELEDNLSFFRGRIAINQHIRENVAKNNPVKIYCQFDELTEDNLINQTIKYTLKLLSFISQSSYNLDMINQLLFTLSEINDRKVRPEDKEKIHFTRMNESFKPVIEKCFMFINNFSVDLTAGTVNHGAILFDMNKLFEEFIANFMRMNKKEIGIEEYEVKVQKNLKPLDKGKRIKLKPDIVLSKGTQTHLIIDTKYKVLDSARENLSVSNSDIYQMLAYGLRGNCRKIVLLYPKPDDFEVEDKHPIEISLYDFKECYHKIRIPKKVEIYIRTIDIMREDLRKEKQKIIDDLRKILSNCDL